MLARGLKGADFVHFASELLDQKNVLYPALK